MSSREEKQWRRGAMINQAYMVAAGHVVAQTLRAEGRLAIYRRHDPSDDSMAEILDPTVAYFSTKPGVHAGLGLEPYTRVTSPLRRSEDFIMLGLLKAYTNGRPLSGRDSRLIDTTVRRLNQREAAAEYRKNKQARRRRPRAHRPQLHLLGE
jgi:exoribonuclease R